MATFADFAPRARKYLGVTLIPHIAEQAILSTARRGELPFIYHIPNSMYDMCDLPMTQRASTRLYLTLAASIVCFTDDSRIYHFIEDNYRKYIEEKYWILGFDAAEVEEMGETFEPKTDYASLDIPFVHSSIREAEVRDASTADSSATDSTDDDRLEEDRIGERHDNYPRVAERDPFDLPHESTGYDTRRIEGVDDEGDSSKEDPTEPPRATVERFLVPRGRWVGAELGRMIVDRRVKPIGDILSIGAQEIPATVAAEAEFDRSTLVIRCCTKLSPQSICSRYRITPGDVGRILTNALARSISFHGSTYRFQLIRPIHEELVFGEIRFRVIVQETGFDPVKEILEGCYASLVRLIKDPSTIVIEPPLETIFYDNHDVSAYIALDKSLPIALSRLLAGGVIAVFLCHGHSSGLQSIVEWIASKGSESSVFAKPIAPKPRKKRVSKKKKPKRRPK